MDDEKLLKVKMKEFMKLILQRSKVAINDMRGSPHLTRK